MRAVGLSFMEMYSSSMTEETVVRERGMDR